MKSKSWMKFAWELGAVPEVPASVPFGLRLQVVTSEEEPDLFEVLAKSAGLDSSLINAGRGLQRYFSEEAPRLWRGKQRRSLAVCHGERIIAGTVYLLKEDEPAHLVSGPCVLSEYRNRGIGAWLLHYSLYDLQTQGLKKVFGVCKQHSILEKYIYPKFGGAGVSCESFSVD